MPSLRQPITRNQVELFLISLLALYFELLLIRWFPSAIQVMAYFTNVILLSAFLGLGLGCLLVDVRAELMSWFPLGLLILVIVGVGFSQLPIAVETQTEHFLGMYSARGYSYLAVLLGVFLVTALFFVMLGQRLGRSFAAFSPLVAYSVNVGGSLAGVILFWALSTFHTSPVTWFSIGIGFSLWFILKSKRQLVLAGLSCLLALSFVRHASQGALWSPYYRLDVTPGYFGPMREWVGFEILANKVYHQYALDFSEEVSGSKLVSNMHRIYAFPYRFVDAKNVLILGAGSGNDALIALENGAERVDAVEIDPVIGAIGRQLPSHRPYLDDRVTLIVDDGRSYLDRIKRQYDVIVFGYLDAHRLLANFSSVRLDNFVYTVESFRKVKDRLTADGMVAVTFFVFRDWIAARVYWTLREVFGDDVLVFSAQRYTPPERTVIFLAGPAVRKIPRQDAEGFLLTQAYRTTPVPAATDDWPYLYLRERSVPRHYVVLALGILVASLALVAALMPNNVKPVQAHLPFAFFGAAFMLMETKSLTRCAVLYGSTWMINTLVIASVFIMILVANAVAPRIRTWRIELLYGLLALAILLEWAIEPSGYLSLGRGLGLFLAGGITGLPLFWAGLIFARAFQEAQDSPSAFAYNLGGAVLGGLLEYGAMLLGFRALSWAVLALYGASYLCWRTTGKPVASP